MDPLYELDISEEEKIRIMAQQSTEMYAQSNWEKPKIPPSETYTCRRCNRKGHWRKNCREKQDPETMRKNPTGIPLTFLKATPGNFPGAMKHQGGYVATAISIAAYLHAKKECGPLSRSVNLIKEAKVPDSLKCVICSESMRDAAKIPCCGRSYCDECIRNSLLNSENFNCPNCKKSGVLPDDIEPSTKFRRAVIAFYNGAESSRVEDILKEEAPKKYL